MRKIYLHPFILLLLVWGGVVYFYGLHWSELQIYDIGEAYPFLFLIFGVFFYVSILFYFIERRQYKISHNNVNIYLMPNQKLELIRNIKFWFVIWLVVTFFEIIFSGGLPIIWMLLGSEKTYFDFGLPSVHGLANGLVSALSLVSFYLYMSEGDRKYLIYSMMIIVWGLVAVTRQIVIVNLLQFVIVYYMFKPPSVVGLIKSVSIFVVFVLLFGWLGDARTGADKFVGLAMPTADYPDYLPSGILWVYMYAVTPMMNLINTINFSCGCESIYFGNTIAPLLPSVIRNIFVNTDKIEKGDVISEAFNVSTAFVDPYTDLGYVGIFIFTFGMAFYLVNAWRRKDLKNLLIYSVLSQSLILTIFYNHFFSLPVISQILWINIFLKGSNKIR